MAAVGADGWANPVVESLEHFYGHPVENLADRLRSVLAQARDRGAGLMDTVRALQADEFTSLYLEQQHSRPVASLAGSGLPEGHLRAAFVGRELVQLPGGRRLTIFMDGEHLGQDRLPATLSVSRAEVKAALCYAHDVVLEDPFDEEQALYELVRDHRAMDPRSDAGLAPDPEVFVSNVRAVADLAALVREGIVRFSPRRLAMNPKLAGRFASNAWDLNPLGDVVDRELVDRMTRVWLHSGGTIVPMSTGEPQERRFAESLGPLSAALNSGRAARLRALTRLAVPAADDLELRRMIDVRHETVVLSFRARQRASLAAVGNVDDTHARALFREEMRSAADQLTNRTRRIRVARASAPKLVGWGVGTVVTAGFDWKAAAAVLAVGAAGKLADLLSSSTAQALIEADRKAASALHHHYATLGSAPAAG